MDPYMKYGSMIYGFCFYSMLVAVSCPNPQHSILPSTQLNRAVIICLRLWHGSQISRIPRLVTGALGCLRYSTAEELGEIESTFRRETSGDLTSEQGIGVELGGAWAGSPYWKQLFFLPFIEFSPAIQPNI